MAYGATQALGKGVDVAYSAMLGAVSAAVGIKNVLTGGRLGSERLEYFFPLVVVDAPLFECYLDDSGEVALAEVDRAVVNLRRDVGGEAAPSVRVVRADAIDSIVAEFDEVSSWIVQALEATALASLDVALKSPTGQGPTDETAFEE